MKFDIWKLVGKAHYYAFQFGLFIKPVARPILDYCEKQFKHMSDKPYVFTMMVIDIIAMIYIVYMVVYNIILLTKTLNALMFTLHIFMLFHFLGLVMEVFKERYAYVYDKPFKLPDLKKLKLWRFIRFV